jgi:hypothetical protein
MSTQAVTELNVEGKEIVAGIGQYYKHRSEVRFTVIDVGRRRPRVLWDDGWPRSEPTMAFESLRHRAESFRMGEFDTMHATKWRLAWTIDAGEFSLWDRTGLRLWTGDNQIHRRGHQPISVADAVKVEATLSEGWFKRGVAVGLKSGNVFSVASANEPMTMVDPAYDFIDVMFDASWVTALAKALAAALGVAVDCTAYD